MNFNFPSFEQIKIGKNFLISAGAIIIFLIVVYFCLFNLEVTKDDLSNHSELNTNPYERFEKSVNSNEVKNLVEDSQFKDIKYYDDMVKERDCSERENPFEKSF